MPKLSIMNTKAFEAAVTEIMTLAKTKRDERQEARYASLVAAADLWIRKKTLANPTGSSCEHSRRSKAT